MAIVAQTNDDLRSVLVRTLAARWPDESLIFTTECERRVIAPTIPAAHQPGSLGATFPQQTRVDHGLVGATERRLVYHCPSLASRSARVAGAIIGMVALIALVLGGGLSGFFPLAFAAIAVWTGGKVIELFVAGGSYIPYECIHVIDELGQRIDGLGHSSAPIQIRIPDRADFQLIVSLATGQGAANAA